MNLANLRSSLALHVAKLMVVIVLESATEAEEARMYNLRRSSGLAARSGLFSLVATASDLEKDTLIDTVCGLAHAQALEFAVSTSKNIRKKKNSKIDQISSSSTGTPRTPSAQITPTGSHDSAATSSPPVANVLSTSGWQFRYGFKLAFLAEYRQDFNSAQDLYESAYDMGLELLEQCHGHDIAKDSTNALIQLLDATAMKIVKLRFYTRQPNTAYRKFLFHLESISQSYGFLGPDNEVDNNEIHQWRAQQVLCFAQLVEDAGIGAISPDRAVSIHPRAKPGNLVNAGFLFLDAGRGFVECHDIVSAIESFTKSIEYFKTCELDRSAAYVCLVMASALSEASQTSSENYGRASSLFSTAARAYRDEAWFKPLEKSLSGLMTVAQDETDKIATRLELTVLGSTTEQDTEEKLSWDASKEPLKYQGICPFNVSFSFSQPESFVGEKVDSNFTWTCRETCKASFKLTKAILKFDNAIDDIVLEPASDGESLDNHIQPKHLFTKVQSVTCSQVELYFNWDSKVQCVETIPIDESITVLPRASQVSVETRDMPTTIYAGEHVHASFELTNRESVAIAAPTLDIKATLEDETIPVELSPPAPGTTVSPMETSAYAISFVVPEAVSSDQLSVQLEVVVSYMVEEDSINDEEPEKQTITEALVVSIPVARKVLRATFDVLPRVLPEPWANPFIPYDFEGEEQSAPVCHSPFIKKRWKLVAYLNYGIDVDRAPDIEVTAASIEFKTNSEVICDLVSATATSSDSMAWSFVFDTYRAGNTVKYDAIRTVSAEALITVNWKRQGDQDAPVNKIGLSAVKLHLTLQEPRVILQVRKSTSDPTLLEATYFIENSTAHILTYDLRMGSNPSFAWQGPKHQFIRMLPYSRREIKYTMFSLGSGCDGEALPPLTVYDTFYKRVVSVLAGNDSVRSDKGELICV